MASLTLLLPHILPAALCADRSCRSTIHILFFHLIPLLHMLLLLFSSVYIHLLCGVWYVISDMRSSSFIYYVRILYDDK